MGHGAWGMESEGTGVAREAREEELLIIDKCPMTPLASFVKDALASKIPVGVQPGEPRQRSGSPMPNFRYLKNRTL